MQKLKLTKYIIEALPILIPQLKYSISLCLTDSVRY